MYNRDAVDMVGSAEDLAQALSKVITNSLANYNGDSILFDAMRQLLTYVEGSSMAEEGWSTDDVSRSVDFGAALE